MNNIQKGIATSENCLQTYARQCNLNVKYILYRSDYDYRL